MPVNSTGRGRGDPRCPRVNGHADARGRDPGLEQHRDGEVLRRGSSLKSSSRPSGTSVSARRPRRSFPRSRAGASPCRTGGSRLHPGQPGDGIRVRGDAGQLAAAYAAIANDGVLLAPTLVKEIRDPSGALLYRHRPEPVGGWSPRKSPPGFGLSSRGGRRGRHGRAGAARQLFADGQDRHRDSLRGRPLRPWPVYRLVRGPLSRRSSAARGDREDRQSHGELLRRSHRRTGHAHHASAGAGFAPGGDRPRPPGAQDTRRRREPAARGSAGSATRGGHSLALSPEAPAPRPRPYPTWRAEPSGRRRSRSTVEDSR